MIQSNPELRKKKPKEVNVPSPCSLNGWVEALLFASETPLSIRDLKRLLSQTSLAFSLEEIEHSLQCVISEYSDTERGLQLTKVAGGWQFRTNPSYAFLLRGLFQRKSVRLSKAAIECMAIVAYQQPLTRAHISEIRGVESGATLRNLLDRKLLSIVGRNDSPGRPYLYGTSNRFLELFGLASLEDLPSVISETLSDGGDSSSEECRLTPFFADEKG